MPKQEAELNMPISDDELLFFYWRDGLSDARQREIAAALKRDSTLQQRLAALSADLGALQAPNDAEVDDLYGARLLRQFDLARTPATTVTPAPTKSRAARRWLWPVAAAVLVSVLVWRQSGTLPEDTDTNRTAGMEALPSRADPLTRRVAVELEQASAQFGQFDQLDAAEREQLLSNWQHQNELFALAAERNGDAQLARTLRAFGPLLEALDSTDSPARDAALSQLQFEYTIMHTKLLHGSSKSTANEI